MSSLQLSPQERTGIIIIIIAFLVAIVIIIAALSILSKLNDKVGKKQEPAKKPDNVIKLELELKNSKKPKTTSQPKKTKQVEIVLSRSAAGKLDGQVITRQQKVSEVSYATDNKQPTLKPKKQIIPVPWV